ncbi:capsular polysaccharide synthesis protein [Melissococcus plutonius]|nr:capsular polysaccharide synthesis protein [Melissococcus plutonius]AIM25678.1 capsular polysaccharide synthesis protein [Melissococcus plutonius S1]KMT24936.1 capsular polysaccharide synthesis protein [Melissococcus plutonius]KMT26573.1 capsular polysaccharide synthesis protein [Melissococcus plutonius]KMT27823.1 capsular polysaccharide synthesis protein [Melissococcus plutonius]KMT29595.1 capsular polysaccharide synthesis protein [Melissococcus plutonius]
MNLLNRLKEGISKKNLLEMIYFCIIVLKPVNRKFQLKLGSEKRAENTFNYLYKHYYPLIKNRPKYLGELHEKTNIIWICWLQGEENAPELIKVCIRSIRKYNPNKKIIILDEKTLSKYATFPNYILEKRAKGIISNTHFSDLLRAQILVTYGGTWMDATLLCTDVPQDYLTNSALFVYRTFYDDHSQNPIVASSWFLSAEKNNDILTATRDMLFSYWEKHNTLMNYYLFHIFFTIATKKYSEQWEAVPKLSNANPHFLQFELKKQFNQELFDQVRKISPIHKLTYKGLEQTDKNSFYRRLLKERI